MPSGRAVARIILVCGALLAQMGAVPPAGVPSLAARSPLGTSPLPRLQSLLGTSPLPRLQSPLGTSPLPRLQSLLGTSPLPRLQ